MFASPIRRAGNFNAAVLALITEKPSQPPQSLWDLLRGNGPIAQDDPRSSAALHRERRESLDGHIDLSSPASHSVDLLDRCRPCQSGDMET
jgi:hypothetical protein